MKLQGKTAIITGAASGIGKEIALEFAREGANVAIADLNLAAANATAAEMVASGHCSDPLLRSIPHQRADRQSLIVSHGGSWSDTLRCSAPTNSYGRARP